MKYQKNVKFKLNDANTRYSVEVNTITGSIIVFTYDKKNKETRISKIGAQERQLSDEIILSEDKHVLTLKGCEVIEVQTINDMKNFFDLQKVFYTELHNRGFHYFWFTAETPIIVKIAELLYSLSHVADTNIYYANLDLMFYHSDIFEHFYGGKIDYRTVTT